MDQEDFKDMLHKKGLKLTSKRMLVLKIIAEHTQEHLTAEEIYDFAKVSDSDIGLATIYRTVQMLKNLSLIEKVSFGDGFARYELGDFEHEHKHHRHHHAICSRCGRVLSFEDDLSDKLKQTVTDTMGFQVTDYEVKLYGYCRECEACIKREEQDGKEEKMEVTD